MTHVETIYDNHPHAPLFHAHKARSQVKDAIRRNDTRMINKTVKSSVKATTAALMAECGHRK